MTPSKPSASSKSEYFTPTIDCSPLELQFRKDFNFFATLHRYDAAPQSLQVDLVHLQDWSSYALFVEDNPRLYFHITSSTSIVMHDELEPLRLTVYMEHVGSQERMIILERIFSVAEYCGQIDQVSNADSTSLEKEPEQQYTLVQKSYGVLRPFVNEVVPGSTPRFQFSEIRIHVSLWELANNA